MRFKTFCYLSLVFVFSVSAFAQTKKNTKSQTPSKTSQPQTIEVKTDSAQTAAQDTLSGKINSPDPIVRRQTIMEMAQTRDLKYAPVIEKYLEDENKLVKMAAIESLGTMRSEGSSDKILNLLSVSNDKDIKNSCIIAISYMPKLEKPEALVKVALQEPDENLKVSAIRTLGSFGVKNIEQDMIKTLNDKKASVNLRVAAANYLSSIKSDKSSDIFLKLLKDENNLLRIEAIRAAGDMQIKSAITDLRVISGENTPEIQLESALSLAKMDDPFALNNMYKYLTSSNASYRNMALNIIGMIGNEESVKILDDKIKTETDPSFKGFMEFTREKIKARIKLSK
ncbi:MAG TPA: HEAT repeat domain-containing protein [Elusimicrobiales bacterium]|nr:HEAT repeat domain-containing protein [Elusimicrobiales bacterium]HPO96027.1 HEAT repeat domain-containing protein [Elusimicrobiales bacterium]